MLNRFYNLFYFYRPKTEFLTLFIFWTFFYCPVAKYFILSNLVAF